MGSKHTALIDDFLISVSRFPRLGCFWKHPSGTVQTVEGRWQKYGLVGSSDVIGVGPGGLFIGLEFKVGSDRLRPAQARFRARVMELGGAYYEVRDVPTILKHLEALCLTNP